MPRSHHLFQMGFVNYYHSTLDARDSRGIKSQAVGSTGLEAEEASVVIDNSNERSHGKPKPASDEECEGCAKQLS